MTHEQKERAFEACRLTHFNPSLATAQELAEKLERVKALQAEVDPHTSMGIRLKRMREEYSYHLKLRRPKGQSSMFD